MEENTTKSPEKEVPISGAEDNADAVEVSEQQTPDSPTETTEDSRPSNNNSDYETVDESGGEEEVEGGEEEAEEEEEEKSARRRSANSLSESATEGSITLEREEGDGQESLPVKKVDDDEDKKNPQYIPKRGTFYEHDDRTADDVDNPETAEVEKDSKKKVWQDKKEKWSHDRFNDSEQAPKSRSELISIYGYDIRNEDGPPRARRRRRYGRGPNKYTRNWEDEDAYGKPPATKPPLKKPPVRRPRRDGEEFPPLNPEEEEEEEQQQQQQQGSRKPPPVQEREKEVTEKRSIVRERAHVQEEKSSTSTKQQQEQNHQQSAPPPRQETKHHPQNGKPHHHQQKQEHYQQQQQHNQQQQLRSVHVGSGRVSKPPKKDIQDSDYRGFTRPKNFKTSTAKQSEMKLPPPPSTTKRTFNRDADFIQSQNFTNRSQQQHRMHELEGEMGKLSVHEGGLKNGGGGGKQGGQQQQQQQQRQGSVPPRLQGEQKSSKRYSSLRQRSLPETAAPPFGQHPQSYYPNDFNQAQQAAPSQPHNPPIIHPATTQVPQIPPPPIPALAQQVATVSAAPILQAPPQFGAPFPQAPPPFLQPGVPAPAFMAQQTPPQLINYVQSQPQFPQPPYPGYQQAFNAVNQPPELYQPQGGITYYSAQEQQVAQRAAPLRRPKAAIPIVPPPPSEPRGRGRGAQQPEPASPNAGSDTAAVPEQTCEISKEFEDAAIAVEQ